MSWSYLAAPWLGQALGDPAALGSQLLATPPDRVLRDDQRSRVLLLERVPEGAPAECLKLSPGPWVLKRPLWRDGRGWNRLVSWFRPGEMRRAFHSAARMLELGLATPRPLMLMERRRWGLLVESWLVYEYVEGTPLGEAHWPLVVEALCRLHAAGLRHGDPHLANWLATSDGQVVALDPGLKRLCPLRADDAYDFVLLRNCQPRILPWLPLRDSWKWRVAEVRNSLVQEWRAFKRRRRQA